MTPTGLIATFALVLAVPLFFGSWRLALVGLGAQAALILAVMLGGPHELHLETAALLALDLVVVRGLVGPLLIARATRRGASDLELELFPGDLLHWVVAVALVAVGVKLGLRLSPGDLAGAAHVATAGTEVLLGFAIVAHQRTVLGQAIGMLTIENGAVLFEALLGFHWPAPIQLGLTAVFVGLIALVTGFLRRQVDASPSPVETSADVEVL